MSRDRESSWFKTPSGERLPTKKWLREDSPSGPEGQGTILVADADGPRRAAYASTLAEMGFTTRTTGSGREALECLLRDRFDACVLDIDVADQNGLTVLSTLMRRKLFIPVVIASKEAYQHEFEVISYPRKTFLGTRDADLVALAVRQLVPSRKADTQRLQHELSSEERARCREIQEMLVVQELPDFPGWDSAALYQPCSVVGGDYLDIFPLPSGRVGVVVADVSGHGFPGAMIMVMVRTAFRILAPSLPPRETVIEINRFVTADIKKRMFVSCLYAVLDPHTGDVQFINCGHNPPVFATRDGSRVLPGAGVAMGLNAGPIFERELKLHEARLDVGDAMVLYTDGVVEAKNADGDDMGEEALASIVGREGGGAQDIVDSVAEAIVEHRGAAGQSDDITVVAFKRSAFISAADAPTLLDSLE
jgi:sigma-B regulation protein RsbU (phosphoserine phosphatase)